MKSAAKPAAAPSGKKPAASTAAAKKGAPLAAAAPTAAQKKQAAAPAKAAPPKMEMNDAPGLSTMPLVVLDHIGQYLSPRLLYDVSATCKTLRAAFNTNNIWQTHSQGGLVGRPLEHVRSLVEPTFSLPPLETLDPLCDQRLNFIRQSRLLHNMRQGQYVHREYCLTRSNERDNQYFRQYSQFYQTQIIYKSEYVFVAGCMIKGLWLLENRKIKYFIDVWDIREEPQIFTTIRVGVGQTPHIHKVECNVVGDKLVILHNGSIRVHEIDLPSAIFPLLWSTPDTNTFTMSDNVYLNNVVIKHDPHSPNIAVWNIDTKDTFEIKSPEGLINGHILGWTSGEGLILLTFHKEDYSATDVHVYDVTRRQYTFHVRLGNIDYCIRSGVVGNNHVVLFLPTVNDSDDRDLVFVYDCQTSNLVVRRTGIKNVNGYIPHTWSLMRPHIIKDCLLTPIDEEGVKVFNLSRLELLFQLPRTRQDDIVNIFRGLCDLIIIGGVVWDFNERRKLFKLKFNPCQTINENFSKIVSVDPDFLNIYSFW